MFKVLPFIFMHEPALSHSSHTSRNLLCNDSTVLGVCSFQLFWMDLYIQFLLLLPRTKCELVERDRVLFKIMQSLRNIELALLKFNQYKK